MEKQQLVDIVLDSIRLSRACVDAKVYDDGKSAGYLGHVAGFYNDAHTEIEHLAAIQDYLASMRSVDVHGVILDRMRTALICGKYAFAASSLCLLAAPILPALALVSAVSAGVSIGFAALLKRREKKIAGIEAGLKQDVEGPVRAVADELKAMNASELGALLAEYRPAIQPYLLQQTA
ncbi:MAG TPA: hypothetical protein HA362_05560 [Nanoarchaeota archaeon]|nr:hypothetical protein [Nanoarchaeota archaeon]